MPLLKPNVMVTIGRPVRSAGASGTAGYQGAPQSNVTQMLAEMHVVTAADIQAIPALMAFRDLWKVKVDSSVAIAEGDALLSIVRMDGKTPWPQILPTGSAPGASAISYIVRYVQEKAEGLFPTRIAYVERMRLTGVAHG